MATLKQRKVLKDLAENGGKPLGLAMREAGYSEVTSKSPQKLTESKGWNELLEEMLPDSLISKVHKKLLEKKEKIVVGAGNGYSEIITTGQPHSDALKAADMAYKLKGRFVERIDHTTLGKELPTPIYGAKAQ